MCMNLDVLSNPGDCRHLLNSCHQCKVSCDNLTQPRWADHETPWKQPAVEAWRHQLPDEERTWPQPNCTLVLDIHQQALLWGWNLMKAHIQNGSVTTQRLPKVAVSWLLSQDNKFVKNNCWFVSAFKKEQAIFLRDYEVHANVWKIQLLPWEWLILCSCSPGILSNVFNKP